MTKKSKRAARRQSRPSESSSPPLDTITSESDSAASPASPTTEKTRPPSPAPSQQSVTSQSPGEGGNDTIPTEDDANDTIPTEDDANDSDKSTPENDDQTNTEKPPKGSEDEPHVAENNSLSDAEPTKNPSKILPETEFVGEPSNISDSEDRTVDASINKQNAPPSELSGPSDSQDIAEETGEGGEEEEAVADTQEGPSNTRGSEETAAEQQNTLSDQPKTEPENEQNVTQHKETVEKPSSTSEQTEPTAELQSPSENKPVESPRSTADSEGSAVESQNSPGDGLLITSDPQNSVEEAAVNPSLEEVNDAIEEVKDDAIEEPKPAAPTPPSSSPQLSQPIQPEPIKAPLDELQSPRASPSMATAQVQGVPDTPLSLNSRSQSPHHYPRSAPPEHFASPPATGFHQRYFSQSPPGAPPYSYYNMNQPNGYPNGHPYAMQSHHPSTPYQSHYGSFSAPFGPYGTSPPTQRHNSIASRGSNPSEFPLGPPGMESASAIDDDPTDLFSRISSAIPDLHLLLSRYKETHGQLGVREELIRKAEAQQADMIKRKDDHIDNLTKQLEELKKSHSSETNKLRLEIGNREEHEKELEEQIAKLEEDKKALEEANVALEAQKVILEQEKADLEKSVAEEKERLLQEFEAWKLKANETFEADKMALAIEFDKKLKEQEVSAEKQRVQANEDFVKEKEALRTDFQRQKRDLEDSFEKVRKEIETKLTGVQKDLEEALKTERESREAWGIERENLIKRHEEERESLHKSWEEQRELMASQHKSATDELHQSWGDKHAEATAMADEERKKAEQFEKEKDDLQRRWEEEKRDREKAFNELKSVAENLGTEKGKLEKLIQAFGDVTDIKSKGDAYYREAFSQLLKQILDLSNMHFTHLPIAPPADILSLIPPGIPSFLGDTTSSRELRAAYVAHTISKILTFRVFTPFLFSLGRRFDKADGLFTAMSNQLRGKSTRKEAIWRQHTLVAAFTSSGAKQRINSAAGSVVEEIVNAVKYFTDPSEEDAIRVAVRRIVKLAAETWRFARLEREIIAAKMPAVDDDSEEHKGADFWPAQTFDSAKYTLPINSAIEEFQQRPRVLLRLFPVIHREAMHECFRITEKEKEDNGCVYSYGLALYDNATPLLAREEELRQAGLPPQSNLSPSASDFPPPTIPPPRNTLPTVPEPGEDEETRASPPENLAKDTESQRHDSGYPTPPKSRAGSPTSPLFAAIGEIDGLKQYSHRGPSLSRRLTGPPMSRSVSEGARRPSGYTISNRSSMDGPSSRMGGRPSRFRSDSHSAAIKGLYHGASMAGGVPMERTGSSLRSNSMRGERTVSFSRVEDSEGDRNGAW